MQVYFTTRVLICATQNYSEFGRWFPDRRRPHIEGLSPTFTRIHRSTPKWVDVMKVRQTSSNCKKKVDEGPWFDLMIHFLMKASSMTTLRISRWNVCCF